MGAAVFGSAALGQQAATPPLATAAHATVHSCPSGSAPVVPGQEAMACEPLNQPETFADLTSLANTYRSRDTAPFGTVAPGAYEAALKQKAAIASPGTFSGSGGAWAPYGAAPECAHQSSSTTACPAPSAANGQYSNVGGLGFVTLSGRVTSFTYDPSTPGRFFASPTAGGVFESLDGGGTWHSIGDGLPTQVVGAIAYDQPLHTLIVGSGDNSFGGDGISGHGVFTTTDDGSTWSTASGFPDLALSFKVVVSPADASGHTIYVASSKGLFKSTNGAVSFFNENLPTSPPGYTPNCQGDTTTPLCFFANIVTDVVVKGTSSTNAPAGSVMAVVGWRAGEAQDHNADGSVNMSCKQGTAATACLQAPRNGIYLSTTASNLGQPGSFTYQDEGQTGPTTHGFAPDAVVGRTALGIAHGAGQDNDAVYALVEDATKFQGCPDVLDQGVNPACNSTLTGEGFATYLDGMYASYNFGASWTKIMDFSQTKYPHTNSSLLGQPGYSPGIQSWYNLWVEPDPSTKDSNGDPQRVAFGLEEIWENNQAFTLPSQLGGINPVLHYPWQAFQTPTAASDPWLVIGRYWNACAALSTPINCNDNANNSPIPGSTTHPDQHAALFVPDGKGGVTLFAGSDGGVYSQHVNAGADFTNDAWGDGDNLGIYSQQPYDAEIANDGTVVAGLQDNGEDKITGDGHQAEIFGGDAFFSTIDPTNSNNIIEEYTYGALSLTNDGGASWFSVTPSSCSSSTALFSTPIEQDPLTDGHVVVGCTQIQESTNSYANPCVAPSGAPPATCVTNNTLGTTVYDLSTAEPSWNTNPIPSAVGVRGADIYVGFCGFCDVVTGGLPFRSGLATNVGGSQSPSELTGNGWHIAAEKCSNCGTPDGKLPQRYITSTQIDPSDPNTVYVTMGGYGRRWIPPGALGDDVSKVGTGHIFVSHDHGENFTDISGNLPDVPANWTLVHNGQLVVATDLGVYEAADTAGNNWGQVGTGLPNTPVFTLRINPTHPDLMVAATYGRGVYEYNFSTPASAVPEALFVPLLPLGAASIFGVVLWRRRRPGAHRTG